MTLEDFLTDWCALCGTEHSYMSGPCERCGSTTFTRKKPYKRVDPECPLREHCEYAHVCPDDTVCAERIESEKARRA